jgi:uncharacterized protein YbjQ (UPF0145 family)
MRNDQITITKVVARNFILDIVASIQNFLGLNLTSYEKMVKKATNQIEQELTKQKIVLEWYRYETTQLTNGAVMIMLYGQTQQKESKENKK